MIRQKRIERLLWLSSALFIACLITAYLTSYHLHPFTSAPSLLEPHCRCEHRTNTHDFCYRLPRRPQIRGQPFNCTYATYLDQLDLLSTENSINLETDQFPDPMYVTAMSDNHFEEGLTLVCFHWCFFSP
ncbi:hypothetical protein GCK32_020154 [Trichostrongylus colubriformis]|uniref:Uncharacterized protein n=1 Tax=Trichostrongylus colubriformis TaxID=6319 RepID=A0AAN8EPM0_TRICO